MAMISEENSPEARDAAARQAARWLIALRDEPEDRELRSVFETWLAARPLHAEVWSETVGVYGAIGEIAPVHAERWSADRPARRSAVCGLPARVPAAADRRRGQGRGRRLAGGLAALALAAGIAFLAGPGLLLRVQSDYVTATAELRSVRLADGSVLRLGPESAASIDMAGDARQVRLLRGEAFFDVVADSARPFRVTARNVETIVVGTAFEVRLRETRTDVAVRRGRVMVARVGAGEAGDPLDAGQWARVDRQGETRRGHMAPAEVAPWTNGQIIARDQPLGEILDELRPYLRGRIVLADPAIAERPLTGVYNLSDPAGALSAIVSAHGGAVRQIFPWLTVVYGS